MPRLEQLICENSTSIPIIMHDYWDEYNFLHHEQGNQDRAFYVFSFSTKWRHHLCIPKFPNKQWTRNIWKRNFQQVYGKESGDTLSLTVEPNCGPPLRYDMRYATGYPFNLRGTIPRSWNVKAAGQIGIPGIQMKVKIKARNKTKVSNALTFCTNHFLTQLYL